MESPAGALSSTPLQGLQEGRVLCTAVRPVGTNNSKRPIPNPKAQGSDPLVHRGELQHVAAELGSYKQAHTSPPPLTLGNSRVVEGPASSQGAGFQSPNYAWRYKHNFNTVILDKLTLKLHNLGLPSSLCHWIRDFLTNRPQVVRIRDNTLSTLVLNTGTPQGCVLSPALFTLSLSSPDNDETHYREEIQHLTQWCSNNNLVLNTSKTKEVIVDYRRSRRTEHAPLLIHGEGKQLSVSTISSSLGIHITSDLTWSMNTAHLLLTNFYRATTESILCLSAAVWYGSYTAQDRKDLARVVKTAQGTVGSPLPDLDSIYTGRMQKKTLPTRDSGLLHYRFHLENGRQR
ncbi:hypothetical protein L3Q82_013689 [Scortum barcoo]|uniref:Uncharacterized protein n=1 Tax=Scortum barcoo TaxID=214431 RepID=A0ACB8W1J5_9TELE|nr:hypothetical protein L3Q82_013689 [Scortum barcoo]